MGIPVYNTLGQYKMTVNQLLKDKALKLRKSGKSYNFISDSLKISKSTVSYWLKDFSWSKEIKDKLNQKQRQESRRKIRLMNAGRKKKLKENYIRAAQEAGKEFLSLKRNRLFVAGVVIYWGEGDRVIKNGQIRISNADPFMIVVFLRFLKEVLKIKSEKIKAWVLLYPDLDKGNCLNYWSKAIGLPKSSFNKSIIIERRGLRRRLNYGVCSITTTSKYLKTKLLKWIDLMAREIVYCK